MGHLCAIIVFICLYIGHSVDIRDTVKYLASCGIPANDIAAYVKMEYGEFMSLYGDLAITASIDSTAKIASNLYEMALAGNVQASIYWLKSVGKWDEMAKTQPQGSDTNFSSINVTIGKNPSDFDV